MKKKFKRKMKKRKENELKNKDFYKEID